MRSLRRLLAMIVKEYKHVLQDPGFLFLSVFSPAVLLTLLTYVFSFNVDRANLTVMDQDQSPQSFEYIRSLTGDGNLTVLEHSPNYDHMLSLLKSSRVDAGIVIPPGFGDRLSSGGEAPVDLVIDASDPSTAAQIINGITQRTGIYSRSVTGYGRITFDVRLRVWFNANLDSQYSMVPGLVALVLILPAMTIALGITREKETGTFESLVTTPILGAEFLIGKLVVYLTMGLIGTLLALAVAVFWFKVPFRGSLLLFILLTADYVFATMAFCILVSHFVSSQRTATSAILLSIFIPSFFMTGLIFPIDTSPVSSLIAFCLPASHYIVISRGITLKALSFDYLWWESLVLLVMGIILTAISIRLFTKKIA